MAGTLTIDTLNKSSGVFATQNALSGISSAWVTFNGTAATVTRSFNVGSITKRATGRFTVNFTTAMPSTGYCIAGQADDNGGNVRVMSYDNTATSTTSAAQIMVAIPSSYGPFDSNYTTAAFFA